MVGEVPIIGERLKRLRKEKNLTQIELGKILCLSKQTISAYENGEVIPPAVTIDKMADFYNCSADYLLCRTENRNPDFNEVEFINIDGDMITKEEAIKYVRIARQIEKITKEVKWKPEKD